MCSFAVVLYSGGGMRVRKTENIDLVRGLHQEIFPEDYKDFTEGDQHWIVWDEGRPVGFCSLRPLDYGIVFLNWAGLLREAQGKGLHKRMIRVRERWCRANNKESIITYTTVDNIQSARNLLKLKYELFLPEYPWAGKNFLYFHKKL